VRAEENGFGPPLSERVQSLRLPTEQPGNSSRLAWALCIVLAAMSAALGYMLVTRGSSAEPKSDAPATVAAAADLPAPVADEGTIALDSKGYFLPARQILVSPKISGMVEKLSVEEGKRVKQGDVLAELEKTDYLADMHRAKASLELAEQRMLEAQKNRPEEIAQARAELAESEAQLKQLKIAWERNVGLAKDNVISQENFEESESRYLAMDNRVKRLRNGLTLMEEGPRIERRRATEAEVRLAEAELRKAQWRLDNCTIRAPISGTILKKNAEEGNIVNPIAFNGSFSLCDMADLSDLEVELTIREQDISRVHKGQKCTIRAEAYPDRPYAGYVSRIMPIADRAKGAIPVRVKVTVPREEEGVYLKPEMGALVSFLHDKPAAASEKPDQPRN